MLHSVLGRLVLCSVSSLQASSAAMHMRYFKEKPRCQRSDTTTLNHAATRMSTKLLICLLTSPRLAPGQKSAHNVLLEAVLATSILRTASPKCRRDALQS